MKLYVQPSKFVKEVVLQEKYEENREWGDGILELAEELLKVLREYEISNIYTFDEEVVVVEFPYVNKAELFRSKLTRLFSFESNVGAGFWVDQYSGDRVVVFHVGTKNHL